MTPVEKYQINQVQKSNLFLISKYYYSFLKTNNSDSDSDSTTDSSKASYLEKYEACNKIMTTLETNCNSYYKLIIKYSFTPSKRATKTPNNYF